MSGMAPIPGERAAELRQAFDQSFAEPAGAAARETLDFIAIRLAGESYALSMAEIAGLFTGVGVTPCPGPLPELAGIAAFRGVLTPVYDLAALLGHVAASGRWLALVRGGGLALSFDAFAGHFRADPAAIATTQGPAAGRHVRQVLPHSHGATPIIDIASITAAIRDRAADLAHKEH